MAEAAEPTAPELIALSYVDNAGISRSKTALHVQRSLAARSQRGRKIPDLLIAAAAEAIGATVLHYNADFDLIASVTGQHCQWVVPAGAIP